MNAVVLWTGLTALGVTACVLVVVIVSRLFDRQRERRYVPPSVLYTEVYPVARETDKPAHEEEFVQVATVANIAASAWALDALSDVRKTASEDTYATLAEFARPVPTSPALIWAGMVGVRHVQGLVTA